jgi:aspartate aminotransferase-like enzyme
MSDYSLDINPTDTIVAFECEADRAEREGFTNVAARQRATALHIRNAVDHMVKICPDGFRVETKVVVAHVPNVNAVAKRT